MTRYTGVWLESAQDELAETWMTARNRNAVTAAAHLIDVELSQDAAGKGVEISEGLRAFFETSCRTPPDTGPGCSGSLPRRGRNTSAQGNALGPGGIPPQARNGRHKTTWMRVCLFRPDRAGIWVGDRFPRRCPG